VIRDEPQGGSPRVKNPGYALLTPQARVRTKAQLATTNFRRI
jgi:hypothetical protein